MESGKLKNAAQFIKIRNLFSLARFSKQSGTSEIFIEKHDSRGPKVEKYGRFKQSKFHFNRRGILS